MFEPLAKSRAYRSLFFAQVIALLGTGLMTVALALLAYKLKPEAAGTVLGTALAIKMIAYVGLFPVTGALEARVNRKTLLVAADLARVAVVVLLPFVSEVWHVYVLVFVLQAASAVFTPTFQATIPDILPDEEDYTKALVLSRLAYDFESLVSPLLAAALLTFVSFQVLFVGTAIGFAASALLVAATALPKIAAMSGRSWSQAAIGLRLFIATPRLHGLAAINFAVAAAGSMVLVNTVVYVQAQLGGSEQQTALALMFFGGGSLIAAMAVPRLLTRFSDRSVMLAGVGIQVVTLFIGTLLPPFAGLLGLWTLFGIGNSLILTPSGRILRRSSQQADRPALFAAQFALSHFGWLIAYPLAGWLGASAGLPVCFAVLGCLAALALIAAWMVWPAVDEPVLDHVHEDLPESHPHLSDAVPAGSGYRHAHEFVIDDLHHRWPRSDRI